MPVPMRNLTTFLILFLTTVSAVFGQQLKWLKPVVKKTDMWSFNVNMAADEQGNFYLVGNLEDSSYVGDKLLLPPRGDHAAGIFMAKFDSSSTLLWAKMLPLRTKFENYKRGQFFEMVIKKQKLYVSARIDSFGEKELAYKGGLLFCTDDEGNLLWEEPAACGGPICLDGLGNILMSGTFYDSAIFSHFPTVPGGDEGSAVAGERPGFRFKGGPYSFLAKFSPDGTLLKAEMTGYNVQIWKICASEKGFVYLIGSCKDMFNIPSFSHFWAHPEDSSYIGFYIAAYNDTLGFR
jgi:hypothetical protein